MTDTMTVSYGDLASEVGEDEHYIDANRLAELTGGDPDEWEFDPVMWEWKSDWAECDGPNWVVEDSECPLVSLTWGDLFMSWQCASLDQLPEMMAALRRAADAFNGSDR